MENAFVMAILVGILALVLVGAFLMIWKRDQSRSKEVSEDSGRFTADPSGHDRSPDH
jgi:hypothetical protein